MSTLTKTISIFLLLIFFRCLPHSVFAQYETDTSKINIQTKEAYVNSRRNPDMSIFSAHKLLAASRNIAYTKGEADASLVLGMAYLAKYNPDDSALYYNSYSLQLYEQIGDFLGQARSCYALAYVYSFKGDMDRSEEYSSRSLDFFKEAGDKRGIVNTYIALTYLAKQKGDLKRARELIRMGIETARSINDTLPLADALNSLGNIYKDMALFNYAIDSYFEALRLWESKEDSVGLSIAYGSIGLMYYFQKDYDRALEFNMKKLPISMAVGDVWEESKALNIISQIYNSQEQFDSSLYYLRRSLHLNNRMNYPSGIATAYFNLANTMLLKSQTDSAHYYISKAIQIAREIDDPALVNYLLTYGSVYRSRGEYSKALHNTLEAYKLAKKQNLPLIIARASALLSDLYSLTGRKDIAYGYLKEYSEINDSINNDEFLKQINRLEIEYEFNKKEEAAEYARMQEKILHENRISKQSVYLKGLLLLIFLLGIISLLYIRHSRVKAQYARIDLEQRLLRAQMNPHFIFNSLCAIQELILNGKPKEANLFLVKIAGLMRNILEHSREEYIALDKEMESLKLYLDLQQLRFETKFRYNFIVDDAIDPENCSVPPMLAQPCVENSIEHGLRSFDGKGAINLTYKLKNGLIILEVVDNGIGRKEAEMISGSRMKKQSLSTRLIENRLDYFRKTLKNKQIGYKIFDLYENSQAVGTKVVITQPFKKIYS